MRAQQFRPLITASLALLLAACATTAAVPPIEYTDGREVVNVVRQEGWRVDYAEVLETTPVLVDRAEWFQRQYCLVIYTEQLGQEFKCKREAPLTEYPYTAQYDESQLKRYRTRYRYVDKVYTSLTTFHTDELIQVYIDETGTVVGPTRE